MYVVVDVETTGLDPATGRVIEVAAARLDRWGQVRGRWASRINPGQAIPPLITEVTGLTDADVADAPRFEHVADELAAVLRRGVLVGHNVAFDLRFLRAEYARAGHRAPFTTLVGVDTLRGAYRAWPGRGRGGYRLGALTEDLGGDADGWHAAAADVDMTQALFQVLRNRQPLPRLLAHTLTRA